jgi:hypothetical protein
MTTPEWPYLEIYGYTWIQHPDGLYYGPLFPGADDHLVWLEERGTLGHSSVRRGSIDTFCAFPRRTTYDGDAVYAWSAGIGLTNAPRQDPRHKLEARERVGKLVAR